MNDTSFKLIKTVLDDLIHLIQKKHPTDSNTRVTQRLGSLANEYQNLGSASRHPVDYSDPLTRFSYVYSYVAAHSSYIKQQLLDCDALKDLIKRDDLLRVTCVGGGPGTELIGLLQASMYVGRTSPLSVWLFDREESWAETWAEIDARVEADFKLSSTFRSVDVTAHANFDNLQKAFASDLFIFSFFFSEIYSFRTAANPFFVEMIASMKQDALVLYIDNSSDIFTNYVESLFLADAFELVCDQTKVRLLPGSSEQTDDLEPYKSQFTRSPKVTSQASIRVWRKK